MELPNFSAESVQERIGVNQVALTVSELGQIWRETPMADVGIDGQIEYVDGQGNATGCLVAAQVKSGPSYLIEAAGG